MRGNCSHTFHKWFRLDAARVKPDGAEKHFPPGHEGKQCRTWSFCELRLPPCTQTKENTRLRGVNLAPMVTCAGPCAAIAPCFRISLGTTANISVTNRILVTTNQQISDTHTHARTHTKTNTNSHDGATKVPSGFKHIQKIVNLFV